ncbi:MAG: transporter substrate-binding domain-containing protein, partial [Lachnospiraceae bacterium]|nr:transporter substrate-binding domain-containing protein [Lachnospiraceae bacterium]
VRDQVQNTLEEMAADGTLAKISTKWFDEDITIIGK